MTITPLETMVGRGIGLHTGTPLTRAAIEAYQGERLLQLVDYCRGHSPWYRQKLAATGIDTIKSLKDLSSLPLTSEEELRHHGHSMLCVSQDAVARIVTLPSSGTTGAPKRLFFTEEDLERTLDFFHQGIQPLVDPGQKVAILLPGATPDSTGHLLARALTRMAVTSHILGLVEDPLQAARQIAEVRPDVLVGFPVQILAIAQRAAAYSIPLGTIRSVLLCSDYIPKSLSARLTELFHCQVFSHYGTVETGLGGGVDCEAHRGCHLRETDLLFEIIDPITATPLPAGDWGEIVFTTLTRIGMPLIRYRTGDYGRLLAGPCPCGSHIQRLDKVLGRIKQFRSLPDNGQLALHTLDEILFAIPGLLDFQATLTIEEQQDTLQLCLVTIPGCENEVLRLAAEVMARHQSCQGLRLSLTINCTSRIHCGKRTLKDNRLEYSP
jgi:phenylacetate-coenzyme A ligase PaaK-like adenylate-forming protein